MNLLTIDISVKLAILIFLFA